VSRPTPPGKGESKGESKGGSKGGSKSESKSESPELARLRRRIDALDRRIVALLNERAELGRDVGRAKHAAGRRSVIDREREREVLLRVALANLGPLAQADLLAIYRRLIAATRALEEHDRRDA
jgi:chorismate mutase/prephenate dehydratase